MDKEHKTEEDKISEQIELLNQLMKVTSGVKENITSDYTLASFNKDEKDFIKENYENGEFAKEIINRFGVKGYRYKWDEKSNDWLRDSEGYALRVNLNENEKKLLKLMSERIFTFFMVSAHMIAVLNRNKTENFLVKLLGKQNEEEEKPTMFSTDDRSILQKIKDKLNGSESSEEND